MYTVPRERFENELVCSLLIDSANILFREYLSDVDRNGADWMPWKNRNVAAYLPAACAALPMSAARVTPSPSDPHTAIVEMPPLMLEGVSEDFLRFLVAQPGLDGLRLYEGVRRPELDEAIRKTAPRVADLWVWASFNDWAANVV